MGRVEDARKLQQDFVTPELCAISARLDAADRRDNERDSMAAERHQVFLNKLDATRREIMLSFELALANRTIRELQARQ